MASVAMALTASAAAMPARDRLLDREVFFRLPEEHVHDHTQVVVGRNGAEHHPDHGQPPQIGPDHAAEHVELADEAGRSRDAGEREQEQREQHRRPRRAPPQSGEVLERVVELLGRLRLEVGQHSECSQVHEGVRDQVDQHSLARVGVAAPAHGPHPGEQVAGMRDGGVGQHPLHVGLHQREQVARQAW